MERRQSIAAEKYKSPFLPGFEKTGENARDIWRDFLQERQTQYPDSSDIREDGVRFVGNVPE
ncbi:hypothetical protein WN51_05503 [Melipona quadrifasciata]|uniref:Uncharacterized protein n=1 Tax=Melipona quadrifasciata TaxID=166423 RepID=A0A0N0BKK8_9HYME|nr:hypothetical protein WN51_05503 [Melipona quadrifasciata]